MPPPPAWRNGGAASQLVKQGVPESKGGRRILRAPGFIPISVSPMVHTDACAAPAVIGSCTPVRPSASSRSFVGRPVSGSHPWRL